MTYLLLFIYLFVTLCAFVCLVIILASPSHHPKPITEMAIFSDFTFTWFAADGQHHTGLVFSQLYENNAAVVNTGCHFASKL